MNPWITDVAKGIPFDNSTNGYTAEDVQAAIEETQFTITNRLMFPLSFGRNGTLSDVYLYSFYNVPSNDSPIVIPTSASFLYVAFSNLNDVGSANIHVYKVDSNLANQTLLGTFNFSGRTYISTEQSGVVDAGWGIQVRLESVSGTKPANATVSIYMRTT